MATLTRVFVYGTLKKGFPNHKLLCNIADDQQVKFIGECSTSEKFPLVIASAAFVPFLLYLPGAGEHVQGEVYEVCDKTLAYLDKLENVGILYDRKSISVLINEWKTNGVQMEVNAYMLSDFQQNLLKLPFHSTFNKEHVKQYIPGADRDFDIKQIVESVRNIVTIKDNSS